LRTFHPSRRSGSAFTLLEMLIALGITGVMFAMIVGAGVGALRSLAVADDYSYQNNEELRAMDYIIRDLRRALTVTIPSGGSSLSMTIPDYYTSYDAQGNPNGNLVTPTIVNGAPVYGNASKPLTVSYAVSGTQLIRTQTIQATGATSTLVVCSRVNGFALGFVALSTTVTFKITFDPKYQGVSTALRSATTLAGTVAVRGIRFQ
jgi:type II secretory pathway pseudopilin PulG